MIKSISVTASRFEPVEFILNNPWETGIAVTNIDGLGPVKSDVSMQSYAVTPGAFYQGHHENTRNVTITYRAVGDPEMARYLLYAILRPGSEVWLRVITDTRDVGQFFYVESNEPAIFSEAETYTVSLLSSSPYFIDSELDSDILFEIRNMNPAFEFDLSDQPSPDLEFDISGADQSTTYYNRGDAPMRPAFEITVDNTSWNVASPTGTIQINDLVENKKFILDVGKAGNLIKKYGHSGFSKGSAFVYDTSPSNFGCWYTRNSTRINLLSACTAADTIELLPGTNKYSFSASASVKVAVRGSVMYVGV